jgi:ribosomal protein S18 acetylase RimI-like enzyme
MRTRSAERVIPFRFGHAYFNSRYPQIWDLNVVSVEAHGEVDPGEVASDAELLHSDAGHAHRRVAAVDDRVGASLDRFLTRLGWESDRLVVMVYRGPGERTAGDRTVDEVTTGDLRDFRREIARDEPWAESEEVVEMLLDASVLWSEVGSGRHFAVRVNGKVVSATDLYSDGRTAQVEDVATSPDNRGRGLASAVVLRAVEEAVASGHDFVFLVANDGTWPKELYTRLGFDVIGHTWTFLR